MGSDATAKCLEEIRKVFQSTLPAWGATPYKIVPPLTEEISIHAPRMGSDQLTEANQQLETVFQSTLPAWGATAGKSTGLTSMMKFQSTLPAWGATENYDMSEWY